ncbi:MAG: HNH endonuclease [Bdellovibrionales bacterium]|nr:HNH endonuclease [Bdellovibrionales bacterium]
MGELSLSTLSQANVFFRKTKASIQEKQIVLEKISGKSYRQTTKVLADLAPELAPAEKHRELGNNKIELKIVITEDLHQKLQDLKSQFSHKNPSMNYADLLEILVNKAIKQPKPKKSPSAPAVTKSISVGLKRQVFKRDKGQCSYTNCKSKHLLQYDHIKSQAFGGEHSVANLRLLCFWHHKMLTEKAFGKYKDK